MSNTAWLWQMLSPNVLVHIASRVCGKWAIGAFECLCFATLPFLMQFQASRMNVASSAGALKGLRLNGRQWHLALPTFLFEPNWATRWIWNKMCNWWNGRNNVRKRFFSDSRLAIILWWDEREMKTTIYFSFIDSVSIIIQVNQCPHIEKFIHTLPKCFRRICAYRFPFICVVCPQWLHSNVGSLPHSHLRWRIKLLSWT